MAKPRSGLSLLVLFMCCFAQLPAHAISFAKSKDIIWQSSANVFFKLERVGKNVAHANDHPVMLDQAQVFAAVSALKLRDTNGGQRSTVFTDNQILLLSVHLAKGLAAAKPDQDVVFALDRIERKMAGLKTDQYYVAGRAFFRDGKLNLIVGDYDRPRDRAYEAAYDPTHQGIVKYDFEHGDRAKNAAGFDKALITIEGIEKKRVDGLYRGDWLVIDVGATAEAIVRVEKEKEVEELAVKRRELRAILGDAPAPEPLPTLEHRFETLEGLKKKGLISEAEYQEKRKQLLSEL